MRNRSEAVTVLLGEAAWLQGWREKCGSRSMAFDRQGSGLARLGSAVLGGHSMFDSEDEPSHDSTVHVPAAVEMQHSPKGQRSRS